MPRTPSQIAVQSISRKTHVLQEPYPHLAIVLRGKGTLRLLRSGSCLLLCRATKMSQLTSRPWPELQKLSSDLENMAFTKANGNQVSYLSLYCLTAVALHAAALGLLIL